MLGLYQYTLIINHKSCQLTLQKDLQNIVTNNVFMDKKEKHNNNKTKVKPKNPCRSRELNPGPLASKADALPLHHRVN